MSQVKKIEKTLSKPGILLPEELAAQKQALVELFPNKPQVAQRLAQEIDEWVARGYKPPPGKKAGWLTRLVKKGAQAAVDTTVPAGISRTGQRMFDMVRRQPPPSPIFGQTPNIGAGLSPGAQGLMGSTLPPLAGMGIGGLLGPR